MIGRVAEGNLLEMSGWDLAQEGRSCPTHNEKQCLENPQLESQPRRLLRIVPSNLKVGTEVVQNNFGHHAGPDAAIGLKVGLAVTVKAKQIEDDRPSPETVYEMIEDHHSALGGIVKPINFARLGEPDGAILKPVSLFTCVLKAQDQ